MLKSYQLLRTNTALTTNIKLVVDSKYKLYLESFNTNLQLSDIKYKHIPINKDSLYEEQLPFFYKQLPASLAFGVKFDNDDTLVQSEYAKQFDTIYWAGAKNIEDQWYPEEYEYLAPLYIRKNKLPSNFIILRIDDPAIYENYGDDYKLGKLTKDNFRTEIINKWKAIQVFDLSKKTDLGAYLDLNINQSTRFPNAPMEMILNQTEQSMTLKGIDYVKGLYTEKKINMSDYFVKEKPHFNFENYINALIINNGIVIPNILNIKFLFDDIPATPDKIKKWNINRYYGFYADQMELITNITSYKNPLLLTNLDLINNVFIYSGTTVPFSGDTIFTTIWDTNKAYYIYINNDLHLVSRTTENGNYVYKMIADNILDGKLDITSVYQNTIKINYDGNKNNISNDEILFELPNSVNSGNFKTLYSIIISGDTSTTGSLLDVKQSATTCALFNFTFNDNLDYYLNIEGTNYKVEKFIDGINSGFTINFSGYFNGQDVTLYFKNKFIIDKFYNSSNNIDSMYGDLYLILIDNKYHVIKKNIDNTYYIQTDYAINSDTNNLEYWIGGKNSSYYKKLNIQDLDNKPLIYPIYRVNFTDIKDFDFNRFDTEFSNFDYEKSEYYDTPEAKLYATEYRDTSDNKPFKLQSIGTDGQYKIMNISSEYIAGDELYNWDKVSPMLRKNQYTPKWGSIGSISHSDYPYKLDISNKIGGMFNRTTDTYLNDSSILSKTLDYFYRIGDFYSGGTTIYTEYENQTTNIEQDVFDINKYINSDIDYFDSFFTGKQTLYNFGNPYLKTFNKYAEFNGQDQYSTASVIFKGIKYYIAPVNNIVFDTFGKISKVLVDNSKNFNNYKFSILFNPVYYFNGDVNDKHSSLSGNTIFDDDYNNINVICNDDNQNILVIINVSLSINSNYENFNNLNWFTENSGLYTGLNINGGVLYATGKQYNQKLICAENYIKTLNNLNEISAFESGVTYHYIKNKQHYYWNYQNRANSNFDTLTGWGKKLPLFILEADKPSQLNVTQSYLVNGIEGSPTYNLKDKFKTDPSQPDIDDYLARQIVYEGGVNKMRTIYRFNGLYEPISKNIELFNTYNTWLFNYKGTTGYTQFEKNLKFDETLGNFGMISELMVSKVNETGSMLKLQNVKTENSIYPMVDEYGYTNVSKFIFKSTWDNEYFTKTLTTLI